MSPLQSSRKELEVKIMKQMDEKCLALHVELGKEKKLREEAEERGRRSACACACGHTCRSCVTHGSVRRSREAQEDGIIKKLNDELVKLQDILQQEQKIREESENSLIRVLEDMCAKMQNEVAMERKDREGTEEIFLKLLEETCDRVQSGLKP